MINSIVQNAVGKQPTVESTGPGASGPEVAERTCPVGVLEYFSWHCPYDAVEED